MDNFIVSARKYRPETFKSVVGQDNITATLKNAIKTMHIGHAYLFCGPRGVGKTTCARIFAKTLNCKNLGNDAEPCNECETCKSFNESRSYNIHELDAASNNSVDDIRTLTEQVRIPPQIGTYSVYIIDEVHMLSASAFNAFLKTLEEPPAHAIFILATTEKHKIIPTILSRCQIFDFNRIKVDDAVKYLQHISREEGIIAEPEALHIIAQKADGAMRDALSIFDQVVSFSGKEIKYETVIENLNILDYEYYFRITDFFLENKISESLLIFDDILDKGFDAHNFITGLAAHLRDLMVSLDKTTIQLLEVSDSIKKRYLEQSQKCNPDFLYAAIDLCCQADIYYKTSRNQRLLIELTLVKISNLTGLKKKPLIEEETSSFQTKEKKPSVNEELVDKPPVLKSESKVEPKSEVEPKISVKKSTVRSVSISIKDAINVDITDDDTSGNEKDTETDDSEVLQENVFSQDELLIQWKNYAETIQKERPRIYSSLIAHHPVLLDNYKIEVILDNVSQLEDFTQSILPELQFYLRRQLENSLLVIFPRIDEVEVVKKKLYTKEDQFDYLINKNPNLDKLKKDFKLDFE
jgi:DNA polymerase III subunit gamma/tau